MQTILDWLSDFASWIVGLMITMLNSVMALFQDIFAWLIDELLHAITWLLNLLPFDSMPSAAWAQDAIDNMPVAVLNTVYLIGVPQALAMIIAALIIRLFLQLIPFTRLGS